MAKLIIGAVVIVLVTFSAFSCAHFYTFSRRMRCVELGGVPTDCIAKIPHRY